MTKIIKFLKNNWYYSLLLMPIISLMLASKNPDNDFWWIVNTGKYMFKNGFPTVEPFTIHAGYHMIVQQWITAILFYILYHYLGKKAMFTLVIILGIALTSCFYKLCKIVSNKNFLSVILTILMIYLLQNYITTRPQTFTYLILIIELILYEKYYDTSNQKYLYALPVLSILQVNLHASVWVFQFIFMLPFLADTFLNKKYKQLKFYIIFAVIMFICGFINPYTYENVFYLFYSYANSTINSNISEMQSPSFYYIPVRISIIILTLFIFVKEIFKNFKVSIRHLLFIGGTLLIFMSHNKGMPYFIIALLYSFAASSKNIDFKNLFNNKIKKVLNKKIFRIFGEILIIIIPCLIVLSFGYISINIYDHIEYSNGLEKTVDALLKDSEIADIKLYTFYNDGGYTEYRGIKSFSDPRAEVFLKRFNKKNTIIKEVLDSMSNMTDKEYKKFIEKYNFTHFIVYKDTAFDEYLEQNGYELLYDSTVENEEYNSIYHLYKNKVVSNEKK